MEGLGRTGLTLDTTYRRRVECSEIRSGLEIGPFFTGLGSWPRDGRILVSMEAYSLFAPVRFLMLPY